MNPTLFAWHDLLHGLQGMIAGDRGTRRIARHFDYTMEACEELAKNLSPNFSVRFNSYWYNQRRDLHDLYYSRHPYGRFCSIHDKILFFVLLEMLDGQFSSDELEHADFWNLFWEKLTTQLRGDPELQDDPEVTKFFELEEKLNPKPAHLVDFHSLLAFWKREVRKENNIDDRYKSEIRME